MTGVNGNGSREILVFDRLGQPNLLVVNSQHAHVQALVGEEGEARVHQLKQARCLVIEIQEDDTVGRLVGLIFDLPPAEVRKGSLGQAVIERLQEIMGRSPRKRSQCKSVGRS